ncbi:MAG: MBL fold metallo-hydrolase [Rhodobacteraceae bacterium]|nr:MBL fold metallo-hydrolase [Paracoccaceae bacterium]
MSPRIARTEARAPRLRSLLAPNPSPLTFRGTNTHILGSGRVAVIDPGPDDDRHLAAILAALDPGETVDHILVTHPHRDHSALAPRLSAATGAPVHAFGTAEDGRSPRMASLAAQGMTAGGDGLDTRFVPDQRMADGDSLVGPDWEIAALHTPGHLGTHLCLAAGEVLFSGDHVMGWSTSVIAPPDGDMGQYMQSLARLDRPDWRRFLPGHGDPITEPHRRVRELIAHRKAREQQVLSALEPGPASAATIAQKLYPDIAPALLGAAMRNVLAHLVDLLGKNRVLAEAPVTADTLFRLA